jgi:hypothetical protein
MVAVSEVGEVEVGRDVDEELWDLPYRMHGPEDRGFRYSVTSRRVNEKYENMQSRLYVQHMCRLTSTAHISACGG